MDPKVINGRKRSRRLAMQAVYQLLMTDNEAIDIEKQFKEQKEFKSADADYFHELLFGIEKQKEQLFSLLEDYIDRPFVEIDLVEKSILLIGAYELNSRIDIPYRVVINEAINVAKKYGAEDGHKYINGILDKAARIIRHHEFKAS